MMKQRRKNLLTSQVNGMVMQELKMSLVPGNKGDEVPPFSSLFLDVLTMRKLRLDLTKRLTKIKQSRDTNLHKAKIFNFLYSKDHSDHSIPDNTFTQQYQKQPSGRQKD